MTVKNAQTLGLTIFTGEEGLEKNRGSYTSNLLVM